MKRFIISGLALLAILLFSTAVLAEDNPGFEALTGIPVMEGLKEDFSERVVFDKAEGRIIRARLAGDVTPDQAAAFYRDTLFQLGWIESSSGVDLTFTRDQEVLTVSFSGDHLLEVTISLRPQS